ncbi:MAG: hypothetical protein J2P28_06975 [Actinobacteria bacterium]|nr:hypothetical protein [Actinomycetota bacterium]
MTHVSLTGKGRPVSTPPARATPSIVPDTPGRASRPSLPALGTSSEGFSLLALNALKMLDEKPERSLLVMSARRREGRSSTVCGLAGAIAAVSRPVVVVTSDPDCRGLERVASSRVDTLWRAGDTPSPPALQLVTPWSVLDPEADLMETTHHLLREAVASGATVILDGPAATESSLAFYLATAVSGVLYVVRPKKTATRAVHAEIRTQLDILGARVLGIVVNEW